MPGNSCRALRSSADLAVYFGCLCFLRSDGTDWFGLKFGSSKSHDRIEFRSGFLSLVEDRGWQWLRRSPLRWFASRGEPTREPLDESGTVLQSDWRRIENSDDNAAVGCRLTYPGLPNVNQGLQIGGLMQWNVRAVIGSGFLERCWVIAGVPCA